MDNESDLNPQADWWLIKIDEREYWSDDIKAQTQAIFSVYAFDRKSATHLCEITPSYCLWFIAYDAVEVESIAENEDARAALFDLIQTATIEPVTYMHISDVEQLIKAHPEYVQHIGAPDADREFENTSAWIDYVSESWGTGALMF